MKIAVYSLTRDRLAYTADCFASLRENAGMPFDHYVFDNGSTDGTLGWLTGEYSTDSTWRKMCGGTTTLYFHASNQGISVASNFMVRQILQHDYDLICKFDNDCFVRTPNILPQICAVAAEASDNWILSPRVEGINKQPKRVRTIDIGGHPVGETGIVGGLFHIVPTSVYRRYMDAGGYPEDLPLAKGQDDHFCDWWRRRARGRCGYVEDLAVEHYETTDGQARRFPDYFTRKFEEEKHA